jgi:NAD(P)-dependent dehydrogenase (short-subunit alcohol dehydrogenase family)
MGELDGKVALITGGAQGFGRAMAHLFAREGADVAIADIEGELGLRTAGEIESLERRSVAIQADVTKEDDCRRMAETALGALGRIDVLCANAGLFTLAPSWELTEAEWDTVLGVNLKGVWLTTKHVVPHMIERRYGKIVITSSRDGLRAEANYAHYNASKAGVIGFMKSLAIELGPYEINVNAICSTQMTDRSTPPRATTHPYWDQVVGRPGVSYEEFDEASGRENLFEAGGQPDYSEVAEGALWLASDRSHLVTGHALPVDRGWIAKRGG